MNKKDQTNIRKVKGVSIGDRPFNLKEIRELQKILDTPHWGRRKLKNEFAAANNRLPKEVDAYIRANGKRKESIDSTKEAPTVEKAAPKEDIGQTDMEIMTGSRTKTVELRFPIESIKIEGNIVVLNIKVPK